MKNRLRDALKISRADYTEIRLERSWTSAVAFRGHRLEGANASLDAGGFVRCLNKGYGWGVASFTSVDRLSAMVSRAHEMSLAVRLNEPIALAPVPVREDDVRLDLDGDVRGISLEAKKKLLEGLNDLMLGYDRRVVDTQAAYRDEVTEYWFASSDGTLLYELRPEVTLSAVATAREEGGIERALESIGLRRGWNSVQHHEEEFLTAARRAVELLKAPRVRGGRYPVVLDSKLAGVFVHEAFGHLSEADFVYENPQAREMMRLGRRFGSELLTIGDDGSAAGLRGTLPYDDEGTPTQNTTLIQNGVLVGRLHSRETAARMGESATGNARALSFRHAPIVRMTNTYIASGKGTREDLLSGIELGVYACDALGGQTYLEDFSFTAGYGYMIRKGKIAEMVRDVTLAGNLFHTLDGVDAIAGDFHWNQMGGGCGKGFQVPLPVTEGAPHIRIRDVAIGGDAG
ncbi:MAG TPA: TldD/PmbA family protein [Gemmatimonadales bacterium]|nr:TldD/PmbA family protein [Gemmatimonadales bacterium]